MNTATVGDLRPYIRRIWTFGENIVFENPNVIDNWGILSCKQITKNTVVNEDNIRVELNELRFIKNRILTHSAGICSPLMKEELNKKIVIYEKILSLLIRRKVIRRLRMYLTVHLLGLDWFKGTMERSYAPDGPGYHRVMNGTLVGR